MLRVSSHNSREMKFHAMQSAFGMESLDNIIGDIILESEVQEYDNNFEFQEEVVVRIEDILQKYLNQKEQIIFKLAVYNNKSILDIQRIMGFNSWHVTRLHIRRVVRIVKIYYIYEQIDKTELDKELKKKFNKVERQIITLLHDRKTIHEVKNIMKYYYKKAYYSIINVLEKLENQGGICKQYHAFLINIRRFKNMQDFEEGVKRVKTVAKNRK